MAYSNQTANYGLPQYVGSDLATWQDNTEAWAKVDAGMQANKTAAARASTAAGQAQATANAAQAKVGAVESEVTTLQGNLKVKTATLSFNSGINDRARALLYSDTLSVLKADVWSKPKNQAQAFTETVKSYWVEWFTCPQNVYQLQPSNVSDNKFWIGATTGFYNTGSGDTPFNVNVSAFWDGTTTHIGFSCSKTWWDGLAPTTTYIVGVTMSSLFAGVIIPSDPVGA